MCGIVGRIGGTAIDEHVCHVALAAIEHRGPDGSGMWIEGGTFLGMRRLAIIDVEGGDQPIWNEDGSLCIIYNGELYNFLDLRPELEARGHTFRTRCDTEVVLHAYEEWGPDCLKRFNGMFAFAIWNRKTRTLFLARDRIGEKPLYYYRDGGTIVFGSEIKAILADPTVPRHVDPCGLRNYLAFGHAVAPRTMLAGISKLPAGHFLEARDGEVCVRQYWDVGDEPTLPSGAELTEPELVESVQTLLDDSVRRRMIADVPIGAFLSGGVDSATVVALMKRHTTAPVKTFSLGFAQMPGYNELAEARASARYLGTDHHELLVEHEDLVQALRTLVYQYDEPFGDAAGFPIYLLSGFARQHVTVALAGDGGDELFGGYRRYAADAVANRYQVLPDVVIRDLVPAAVDRLPRLRRLKRLAQTLPVRDAGRRYASWLEVFTSDARAELLDPRIGAADHDPVAIYPPLYAQLNGTAAHDHLNRLMYIDLKTWLVDGYMEKTDKASMARSLEVRLPMLDHRLVELAFQIPARFKIRGMSTKRILKHAVRDLVPPEVLNRPKRGFSVPTDPWFRGALKGYAYDVLLDVRARNRGYFDAAVVERMWREHAQGRHVWDGRLWLLLNFELWCRIVLDGERP